MSYPCRNDMHAGPFADGACRACGADQYVAPIKSWTCPLCGKENDGPWSSAKPPQCGCDYMGQVG